MYDPASLGWAMVVENLYFAGKNLKEALELVKKLNETSTIN